MKELGFFDFSVEVPMILFSVCSVFAINLGIFITDEDLS